ncbi:uncharacterized protein LOC122575485 isoform X4 [Bombus pyrosoma]|uniref:uncharacterized protein LOC122575485 isoform X4 n=1 Tax=Bombus pyrosoma TaxID=396416 RepID=UPI001CB9373F|nr:uncharacterized protein LOC122575485 isoform X4 [Bombus pyrosoma]
MRREERRQLVVIEVTRVQFDKTVNLIAFISHLTNILGLSGGIWLVSRKRTDEEKESERKIVRNKTAETRREQQSIQDLKIVVHLPRSRNGHPILIAVRGRSGGPGTGAGATDARSVRRSATGPPKQERPASVTKSSVATTSGRRTASNPGGLGFGSHAAAGFGVVCRGATSARCAPGDRICAQQPNQGRDIPVSGIQQ